MKTFPLLILPFMFILSACGGGGSGDSFNSSYSGTVTLNGTRYECPSQKSFDACNNSTNRDCSGCKTDNSNNNGAIITAACVATSSTAYQVTQDGCTVDLSSGKKTGVCVSGSLRLLSGTGLTKAQVSTQGASFSNGVSLNGVTLKCST